MQTQAALDNKGVVERLEAMAWGTGLPVVIFVGEDGIQVGVLNLIDLNDDDFFQRPIPIEQLAEEGEKV